MAERKSIDQWQELVKSYNERYGNTKNTADCYSHPKMKDFVSKVIENTGVLKKPVGRTQQHHGLHTRSLLKAAAPQTG